MNRLSFNKDGRSRSLLISVVSGVALLLLAVAVFSVAGQARSLSTQAERSVQTVEDLRVASFAHSEIVIATRIAEVSPGQTEAIVQSVENAMVSLDSVAMSFDDMTGEEIQTAFTNFEQAVISQSELLSAGNINPAALTTANDSTGQTFAELVALMRSEQIEAVTALESDNDLLNLIATMSTFIVAFVVPSAALFVFQALRAAPRELRSLRLDHDRIERRSRAMATAVSEEARELRERIAADPTSISIGSVEKSLRRFEHISVTNGAQSTIRSEQVDLYEAVAQTISDLNAASHVEFRVPQGIAATADQDQLSVVLSELLGNAFEHGEGPVAVLGESTAEHVVVRVIDSGYGIDDLTVNAVLLESDYELRENAADGAFGYGLLAARRALESMGGALRYERQNDQTHLVASLPIGRTVAPAQGHVPRAA